MTTELYVDGQLIPINWRGQLSVRDLAQAFFPDWTDCSQVVKKLGDAEYTDDLESVIQVICKLRRVRNESALWSRISYEKPEEKEEEKEEEYEEDSSSSSSSSLEEVATPSTTTSNVPDVAALSALSAALVAVKQMGDQPHCERNILSKLMTEVDKFSSAVNNNSKNLFGVSERAEQLCISLDGHSVSAIGIRAAELYREIYDVPAPQRWITLSNGKICRMNLYTPETAPMTLDVALREICKKRRK